MQTNNEIPEEIPSRLREVMWCINGFCGIMPYHSKYCECRQDSKYFLKNAIEEFFRTNNVNPASFEFFIKYVLKTFSVYYSEDDGIFKVGIKKNKKTEKREIVKEEIDEVSDSLGFTSRQMKQFLKAMFKYIIDLYQSELMKG